MYPARWGQPEGYKINSSVDTYSTYKEVINEVNSRLKNLAKGEELIVSYYFANGEEYEKERYVSKGDGKYELYSTR